MILTFEKRPDCSIFITYNNELYEPDTIEETKAVFDIPDIRDYDIFTVCHQKNAHVDKQQYRVFGENDLLPIGSEKQCESESERILNNFGMLCIIKDIKELIEECNDLIRKDNVERLFSASTLDDLEQWLLGQRPYDGAKALMYKMYYERLKNSATA